TLDYRRLLLQAVAHDRDVDTREPDPTDLEAVKATNPNHQLAHPFPRLLVDERRRLGDQVHVPKALAALREPVDDELAFVERLALAIDQRAALAVPGRPPLPATRIQPADRLVHDQHPGGVLSFTADADRVEIRTARAVRYHLDRRLRQRRPAAHAHRSEIDREIRDHPAPR